MEFVLAHISLLMLYIFTYSASYYVTRALVLRKLKKESFNRLADYRRLLLLYLLTIGGTTAVYLGMYRPVMIITGFILFSTVYLLRMSREE